MKRRLFAAAVFITALIACDRSTKGSADTVATKPAAPPQPREPVVPQAREVWIPQWEVAFQHTDSIDVSISQPTARCERSGNVRLRRDSTQFADRVLVVTISNEPFDSIVMHAGYQRRGDGWTTVSADGKVVDAVDVTVTNARILRGGRFGASAPTVRLPTDSPWVSTVDTSALRHQGFVATIEHPNGCTVLLRYLPHYEGGDDTAAVRKIVESVRLGPQAVTMPFGDSADIAYAYDSTNVTAEADSSEDDGGIGVVMFADSIVEDTVSIHATPESASRVVARIIYAQERPLRLLADGPLEPMSVQYGNEMYGLFVHDMGRERSWARVEYARDTVTKATLFGWLGLSQDDVSFATWTDLMVERNASIFFTRRIDEPFHASPGGPTVPAALVGRGAGLSIVEVRDNWMLVRAQMPDDGCGETAPRVRETFVWIRHLDARGRTVVSYAPRGC